MAISTMKTKRQRNGSELCGAEAGDQADDRGRAALNDGDGGAAERAADHDLDARDRGDQRLLEEAELAVPEHADAGEDGA